VDELYILSDLCRAEIEEHSFGTHLNVKKNLSFPDPKMFVIGCCYRETPKQSIEDTIYTLRNTNRFRNTN
jgi:hypothetical protein